MKDLPLVDDEYRLLFSQTRANSAETHPDFHPSQPVSGPGQNLRFGEAIMQRHLLVLCLLSAAPLLPAQRFGDWGRRFRDTDASFQDPRSLARELEQRTDAFKRQFDHQIDRTRWDETPVEDYVWNHARRLENAVDSLRSNIERGRHDDRIARDLHIALQSAGEIDRAMRRIRLGPDAERNWRAIRAGLSELARCYRVTRY
jgi:hypothetical protein